MIFFTFSVVSVRIPPLCHLRLQSGIYLVNCLFVVRICAQCELSRTGERAVHSPQALAAIVHGLAGAGARDLKEPSTYQLFVDNQRPYHLGEGGMHLVDGRGDAGYQDVDANGGVAEGDGIVERVERFVDVDYVRVGAGVRRRRNVTDVG